MRINPNNYEVGIIFEEVAVRKYFIVPMSGSSYFFHRVAKKYFKERGPTTIKIIARKLGILLKQKALSLKKDRQEMIKIQITPLGNHLAKKMKLEKVEIKKTHLWDGQWRLLIYDFPGKQKSARDNFRYRLKKLGLRPLQYSAWITPYDCLEQIKSLCQAQKIDFDKHFYFLKVSEISHAEKLKKLFGI